MNKKKFKMPSAFVILFTLLCLVAAATWVVPAGEYAYNCYNSEGEVEQAAQIYEVGKKIEAVCPTKEGRLIVQDIILNNEGSEVSMLIESEQSLVASDQTIKYEYQQIEESKQGIWQVLESPVTGFQAAIEIIAFVFVIGGFINIVIKTGALDAGIYSLLKKFRGRETLLIPILMTIFAIGGTTFGMAEETLVFYVILIPVLYRAGFDNVVGAMVVMLGAGVGVLGSTVNPFAIGVASTAAGIDQGSGIVSRFLLWAIVLLVTIIYVMWYAKRVKKDPTKSIMFDKAEEIKKEFGTKEVDLDNHKMNGSQKLVLSLFILTFVIMVLSILPWESVFGISFFVSITESINNVFPALGGSNGILAFGDWFLIEMTTLFLIFAFIIGIIGKTKGMFKENVMDLFIEGTKDMMSVALIIGLARGIQGILGSSGMDATLLYYGSNALSGLQPAIFTVISYVFYLPLSFLVPSTSGLATASIPIMGDLGAQVFDGDSGKIQVVTAFSSASGLVNLITPTSGVVMGGLLISKVDYGRWVKLLLPLIIIIFLITALFLFVTTQFGFFY